MHMRSVSKNALCQCCRRPDYVLATVEDQQHPSVAEKGNETWGRIVGINQQAERRRDRARHEKRVIEWPKIKKANGAVKGGQQPVPH